MNAIWRAAVFCLAILALPCAGRAQTRVFDVYLRITPPTGPVIPGTATEPLYAGWIKVLGFEAGSSITIPPIGSGSPTERAKFTPFTLIKQIDAGTPISYQNLCQGGNLGSLKMVVVSRKPSRAELWELQAETAVFTKQEISAESGAEPEERITIQVGRFSWIYTQISPTTGAPLNEIVADWSIITNSGSRTQRSANYAAGIDTDGDGIPNAWETYYSLDPNVNDAADDPDDDGMSNLDEYIARTNPKRADSTFRMSGITGTTPGTQTLTWNSSPGVTYRVQYAPNPDGPWQDLNKVVANETGTETSTTVSAASGIDMRFYRISTE